MGVYLTVCMIIYQGVKRLSDRTTQALIISYQGLMYATASRSRGITEIVFKLIIYNAVNVRLYGPASLNLPHLRVEWRLDLNIIQPQDRCATIPRSRRVHRSAEISTLVVCSLFFRHQSRPVSEGSVLQPHDLKIRLSSHVSLSHPNDNITFRPALSHNYSNQIITSCTHIISPLSNFHISYRGNFGQM